ncbi:MAG: DNA polymerase III subunit beta [Porphyromonadaceae bacterium]|nr:DNA polymerase III subunit beta [Porphyromonadaceae bacterium]
MKFSVTSGELKQHLQTVSKVINPKSITSVPVLANILFELEGNLLTLTAADVNSRISSQLQVQNEGGSGCFTVPNQTLIGAINELPDQPITLEVDEQSYQAKLNYSNGQFSFLAYSADTYPAALELTSDLQKVTLGAGRLLSGLEATMFAASDDERRPIMTGVLLDFLDDRLVYVASDGRILVRRTDYKVQTEQKSSLCLPAKICQLLVRILLPKESGDVQIAYDGKHIQLCMEQYTLTARLLDGRYPNYNSVIPPSSPYHIIVDKDALLYAAKRVSLFSNKASRLILLEIQNDKIRITANDLDLSAAAEEFIPCQSDSGENRLRIAFDFDMLQGILQALKSDQITLAIADQTRAGIITPNQEEEGEETLSLIIPLKLIGE